MTDMAASVLARLKNKAKAGGISYQQCLQLFFQEEFLRKLSASKYKDNLILKGGLFIYTLTNFESRATIDVDFMLRGLSNDMVRMDEIIAEILAVPTGNDFITFKAQLLMKDAQNDPIKRAALIGDMVQSITQIPDSIQRSVYVKECARLMDIDERVLVEEVARKRVVQTGGGREASDFIRRQQMRQRSEEQAAVPEPQVDFTKGVAAGSATQELEKELLKYLLKYGHRNFDFKEGRDVIQMNVADVILSTLDAQELHFQTEVYRKMLDTYREQRAELGEGVEVPAHLFINHPDPAVCNAAVDILTSDDNYVPSKLWKQKEVHVESVEEILAQGVPKAVILYKSNAIKKLIDEQMQRLASGQLTEEEELEATTLINTLNCEKTNISHKVQRTIL